jgi:hypothetical protein
MKDVGTLVSFKVYIDSKGTLYTEVGGVPLKDLDRIFKSYDLVLITKLVKEARIKIDNIHDYLEKELQAL